MRGRADAIYRADLPDARTYQGRSGVCGAVAASSGLVEGLVRRTPDAARCMTSSDELAAQIVGIREERQPLDAPGELGFHCPVCQYPLFHDGDYDDRLAWSQYNGFLHCWTCGKHYPSALCIPNVDRAIKIYLLCVKEAIERSKRTERAQPPWA